MSQLEEKMAFQLKAAGIEFEREHKFHPTRRWRFDFSWPNKKLYLEVEGGTWVKGAHTRGKHYESDCEKYNEAAIMGWRGVRVTTDMVKDGRALSFVERLLTRQ